MLVLKQAGLVFLSNPKTAGSSIRRMLAPHAAVVDAPFRIRHMNIGTFIRVWRGEVAALLGAEAETVAVMREPMEHMESWYRFRQRDAKEGQQASTIGVTFAEFVAGRLADQKPAYARLGRQDRFLGAVNGQPQVTHVFDYARLELLIEFLSDRLGQKLVLPKINVSPGLAPEDYVLPEELEARYRAAHAAEFALYDRVARAGMLVTRP